MEEFLRYVVGKLAHYPDEVVITKHEEPGVIAFRIALNKSDVGRVIGKQSCTISAIRHLMQASARHREKVTVEVLE